MVKKAGSDLLSQVCEPGTIGAAGLNFSVRNGKRCDPCAVTTGKLATRDRTRRLRVREAARGPGVRRKLKFRVERINFRWLRPAERISERKKRLSLTTD